MAGFINESFADEIARRVDNMSTEETQRLQAQADSYPANFRVPTNGDTRLPSARATTEEPPSTPAPSAAKHSLSVILQEVKGAGRPAFLADRLPNISIKPNDPSFCPKYNMGLQGFRRPDTIGPHATTPDDLYYRQHVTRSTTLPVPPDNPSRHNPFYQPDMTFDLAACDTRTYFRDADRWLKQCVHTTEQSDMRTMYRKPHSSLNCTFTQLKLTTEFLTLGRRGWYFGGLKERWFEDVLPSVEESIASFRWFIIERVIK